MRLSHVPLRLATGAFILNSGLDKRGLDRDSAAGIQGMAANAIPRLGTMAPEQFGKAVSVGEIALGAADGERDRLRGTALGQPLAHRAVLDAHLLVGCCRPTARHRA